jgi:uncharacterized protein (TIGR02246 family)
MKADAQTKAAVVKTLNDMWKAYSRKDVEGVVACYAPDADATGIGSGADEIYVGPKQFRKGLTRDFAQADEIKVSVSNVRVSASGSVAWAFGKCVFAAKVGGESLRMAGRLTAVLEKRRGKWLIQLSQFAMPYAGQAEGQSFPRTT